MEYGPIFIFWRKENSWFVLNPSYIPQYIYGVIQEIMLNPVLYDTQYPDNKCYYYGFQRE